MLYLLDVFPLGSSILSCSIFSIITAWILLPGKAYPGVRFDFVIFIDLLVISSGVLYSASSSSNSKARMSRMCCALTHNEHIIVSSVTCTHVSNSHNNTLERASSHACYMYVCEGVCHPQRSACLYILKMKNVQNKKMSRSDEDRK